jgi:hypothetical protein
MLKLIGLIVVSAVIAIGAAQGISRLGAQRTAAYLEKGAAKVNQATREAVRHIK